MWAWKRSSRNSLGVILVGAAGIATLIATAPDQDDPDPGPTAAAPFVLSYIDQNWQQRIRWSEDGTTWTNAQGGTPEADRAAGLAANGRVLYLAIFVDGLSKAKYLMGLGPDVWDNSASTVGDGHQAEIASGPSLAHLDGDQWLVAYAHQNQAKIVTYNSSTAVRDFGNSITPVLGVVNANLMDRPALANLNGTVLASWLMGAGQLQMVTGTVQGGAPVWDTGYRFDQNVTEQGFGSPVGAQDIAQDGQRFYAAVVRQRDPLPDEILARHFLFIYTSPNGLNWTRLSFREVFIPTALSMAARGTDDVIAILTRQTTQADNLVSYRYDGTDWSVMDDNLVFGANLLNAGHDFTLFAPN